MSAREGLIKSKRPFNASWNSTEPPMALRWGTDVGEREGKREKRRERGEGTVRIERGRTSNFRRSEMPTGKENGCSIFTKYFITRERPGLPAFPLPTSRSNPPPPALARGMPRGRRCPLLHTRWSLRRNKLPTFQEEKMKKGRK